MCTAKSIKIFFAWTFFLAQLVYLATCSVMISKHGSEMSYIRSSVTNCHTNENQVQHLYGISLSDCVLECGLRQHCLALSYHHRMSTCLLIRNMTETFTVSEKCTFILKSNIIVHQIPCEQECDDDMTCDPVSRTCKYKECIFPRPASATVLGNMVSIGSRLKYKCDKNTAEVRDIVTATCLENGTWSYIADCYPLNCDALYQQGNMNSGVYLLMSLSGQTFNVWCEMSSTTDTGWIVIQRRVSDSDFYKTWEEYKTGFGDLNGNFWLGNENIWTLTKTGTWMLRIDLTYQGETGFAEYSSFSIGDETSNYVLWFDQYVAGNIGDSLSGHKGRPFSTKDRDNDNYEVSCAQLYLGAWWYGACHSSNLNGDYGNTYYGKGMTWQTWKEYYTSMTTTEMKIREIT